MGKQKNAWKRALFCVILILVIVVMISGLRILESTVFYDEQEQADAYVSKTISVDGTDYYPRRDITVLMLLGIDQTGPVQDSGSYRNSGASDVVMLILFDEKQETYSVLALNRDTMVEMPVLGIGGREAGTAKGQLALAHTYGSGLEDSCENVRKTVSGFLNGITIDYYLSLNMDAIAVLNDMVGGVTVTVTEDFSAVDPTIAQGTVTLHGEQAVHYLRSRRDVGNQLNVSRMERHRSYMYGFAEAFQTKLTENDSFVMTALSEITPYMVTDCSVNTLTSMMERYADYTLEEIVSPEGKNMQGEEHYEFYAEKEKLEELILRLFYAPK